MIPTSPARFACAIVCACVGRCDAGEATGLCTGDAETSGAGEERIGICNGQQSDYVYAHGRSSVKRKIAYRSLDLVKSQQRVPACVWMQERRRPENLSLGRARQRCMQTMITGEILPTSMVVFVNGRTRRRYHMTGTLAMVNQSRRSPCSC